MSRDFTSINVYDEYTKSSVMHAGERALTARILRKDNLKAMSAGAFEDVMRVDPDDGLFKPYSWFKENKRHVIYADVSKAAGQSAGWNHRAIWLVGVLD